MTSSTSRRISKGEMDLHLKIYSTILNLRSTKGWNSITATRGTSWFTSMSTRPMPRLNASAMKHVSTFQTRLISVILIARLGRVHQVHRLHSSLEMRCKNLIVQAIEVPVWSSLTLTSFWNL